MKEHDEKEFGAAVTLPWDQIGGPESDEGQAIDESEVESVDEEGRVVPGERWLIEGSR